MVLINFNLYARAENIYKEIQSIVPPRILKFQSYVVDVKLFLWISSYIFFVAE